MARFSDDNAPCSRRRRGGDDTGTNRAAGETDIRRTARAAVAARTGPPPYSYAPFDRQPYRVSVIKLISTNRRRSSALQGGHPNRDAQRPPIRRTTWALSPSQNHPAIT